MASITREPNGRRTIQFVGADGKRRSIRLGKCDQRTAEGIKLRVELLNAAKIAGHADAATLEWLTTIGDDLADKLARVGLAQRREAATLGPFVESYINSRHDAKVGTVEHYRRVYRDLVACFGADKPLREITPGDGDGFRLFLIRRGLAENTVRRVCGRAKQFFTAAKRKRLVQENPFADLPSAVQRNAKRFQFITQEEAQRVLDACPDAQWRLLFALSRYGGLRCPSEHLALRWVDVDWERGRMTVRSCKTEHHPGGESRVVPLFAQLRPHLEEVWEQAEPGTEYVITRYRDANANLRTQLERIIRKAGLTPWPKLFQNLRSTRETELAEKYPMHVVCNWIGNSEPVAAKHYLQTTEEHFRQAQEEHHEAVQNPVQQAHANPRGARQQETQTPGFSGGYEPLQDCTNVQAPRLGLEPRTQRLTAACSTN